MMTPPYRSRHRPPPPRRRRLRGQSSSSSVVVRRAAAPGLRAAPPRRFFSLLAPLLPQLLLLLPSPRHAVYLDVHVPLLRPNDDDDDDKEGRGCVYDLALLANDMLREVSHSSELIDLRSSHVPHVTLYLADFDLEVDDFENEKESSENNENDEHYDDDDGGGAMMGLNRTRVNSFLDAISSIDIGKILASAGTTTGCPLSLSSSPSSSSSSSSSTSPDETAPPYVVNGDYTMLHIDDNNVCLRYLSDALMRSLNSYLKRPSIVPSWVANLPEPERSMGIYRTREYGSPNVMDGYVPHVTVGYDPDIMSSSSTTTMMRERRISAMERWSDVCYSSDSSCVVDVARMIAVGRTGPGGTVLANGILGYWEFPDDYDDDDDEGRVRDGHEDGSYAVAG